MTLANILEGRGRIHRSLKAELAKLYELNRLHGPNLETPVRSELVQRMVAVLRHCAPDDEGSHVPGPIGLAVRRLEIVDPSGGAQPLCNEDGSVVAAFNGEIYNFCALQRTLAAQRHRFATDTEVIVHAYEEYGTTCVDHLRDMFAFALRDERRRSLFLARDCFGIKPSITPGTAASFCSARSSKRFSSMRRSGATSIGCLSMTTSRSTTFRHRD